MIQATVEKGAMRRTILVAEDEILVRLDISDYFRSKGFSVLEVSNAEDAMRILKSGEPISLVFTDIRMPGALDGLDLARYVKKHHPDIGILITSGHAMPGDLPVDLGPVIGKPYLPEAVLAKVRKLLPDS